MKETPSAQAPSLDGYSIGRLREGQTASFSKTISESDVYQFAGVTGDMNPAHINEEYAKNTRFHGRIAHGMLTAGMISAVLGVRLPGPGSIYRRQSLSFLAPVHIGDTVTAEVTVRELDPSRNRAYLTTICRNQDGTVVTEGTAEVLPPRPQAGPDSSAGDQKELIGKDDPS